LQDHDYSSCDFKAFQKERSNLGVLLNDNNDSKLFQRTNKFTSKILDYDNSET
jgi:hypothetical protein